MEKIRYVEKANAAINSENFEDPRDGVEAEAKRLKDAEIHPGDSGLNYPD